MGKQKEKQTTVTTLETYTVVEEAEHPTVHKARMRNTQRNAELFGVNQWRRIL